MKEIDAEHYCIDPYVNDEGRCQKQKNMAHYGINLKCTECGYYRRKWETPAQYKERTGEEWPDNAAVYMLAQHNARGGIKVPAEWNILPYKLSTKRCGRHVITIVCANSDFGCPPDDWEPK
jgi:hypothetical protein